MTLIELLVAMAILAILAGLAARSLSALSENEQYVERKRQQWEAITALFARIEDDVGHAVDWGLGDTPAAGLWQVAPEAGALALVRIDGRQDRRVRVSWQQRESAVEMAIVPLATTAVPDWQVVLPGVRRLAWKQMDDSGAWHDDWPWPQRLPRALSVVLEMEDGTHLERVFALAQAA
jgi:prepilin-type N-terminal cleavage/methylation domain-containing protein